MSHILPAQDEDDAAGPKLLDPAIRGAQSAWGFVEADAEARFVTALSADLKSGAWDKRYGHWRNTPVYKGAMCQLVNTPA